MSPLAIPGLIESEDAAIFSRSTRRRSSTEIKSHPFLRQHQHNNNHPTVVIGGNHRNLENSNGLTPGGIYGIYAAVLLVSFVAWACKLNRDIEAREAADRALRQQRLSTTTTTTAVQQQRNNTNAPNRPATNDNEPENEQRERAKLLNRIQATKCALIVKQVIADCDNNGGSSRTTADQLLLGSPKSGNRKVESSVELHAQEEDDDDDNWQQKSSCVICLQAFRVGDLVAWSKRGFSECENNNTSVGRMENAAVCHHVFHRHCIESWLICAGHNDCPSCRTNLLHVNSNENSGQTARPAIHTMQRQSSGSNVQLGLQYANNGSSMKFVIINGLVSRLQQTSCLDQDDEDASDNNIPSNDTTSNNPVPRSELIHMISLSDLRRMNQIKLGPPCTTTEEDEVPGSAGDPTVVFSRNKLLLFKHRSEHPFQSLSLNPRSCSLWDIDNDDQSQPKSRRHAFQKRSLSEVTWKMYQLRHRSRRRQQSEIPPRPGLKKSFQRDEQLLCPMMADEPISADPYESIPLSPSQSCSVHAFPMAGHNAVDALLDEPPLNRIFI